MPHPRLSRRSFLAAVTSTAAALTGCATGRSTHATGIVDTHTHFYDPTRPEGVPWPPKDDAVLYRRVLPMDLKRLATPLGVTGTVVVEASPWVEDNQWVLDLAAHDSFIVGLVGHLKPGKPDFERHLKRFAANPFFRGIRTGLWDIPLAPDDRVFIRALGTLARLDLSLDVIVQPDQLPTLARLAAAVPDLRIVIDHCAGVRVDGRPPAQPWVRGIEAVARHPNVFMKVSGLVEGTARTDGSAPADVDFYRPVLDVLWNAFGEDRVIYGSNWPVSERFARYGTVLGIVREYFNGKGSTAAAKYFSRNASRIYQFVRRRAPTSTRGAHLNRARV
jgi:predicted TIM-barrel fold metal-dependent hydrolase